METKEIWVLRLKFKRNIRRESPWHLWHSGKVVTVRVFKAEMVFLYKGGREG